MNLQSLISLFRVQQYIKNLFIFAPMIFAFAVNGQNLVRSLLAFILFSLTASGVYIINDLLDIEDDRQHPSKKTRPLAAGKISRIQALQWLLILVIPALVFAYIADVRLLIILTVYLVINISYSSGLKHIPILDIFLIAIGYVLRLFAGAAVCDVPLSMWIILMTFLLALFLALGKRREDVLHAQQGREVRRSIGGYNLEFVNASMTLMTGVIIVSYILYTVSGEVITRFGTSNLYLTTGFVIMGLMRYLQITLVEENSGDPTSIVIHDRFLQLIILTWLLTFFGIALWVPVPG